MPRPRGPVRLQAAAQRFFAATSDLIAAGVDTGDLQLDVFGRLQMLVVATKASPPLVASRNS